MFIERWRKKNMNSGTRRIFFEIKIKFKYFINISRMGWIKLTDDDVVIGGSRTVVGSGCTQFGQQYWFVSGCFGGRFVCGDFNDW